MMTAKSQLATLRFFFSKSNLKLKSNNNSQFFFINYFNNFEIKMCTCTNKKIAKNKKVLGSLFQLPIEFFSNIFIIYQETERYLIIFFHVFIFYVFLCFTDANNQNKRCRYKTSFL